MWSSIRYARLAATARDCPWSSAQAHLEGRDDDLLEVAPLLEREADLRAFLDGGLGEDEYQALRVAERMGRPFGSAAFVASLESDLGRPLARRKPGPQPAVRDQSR